MFASLSVAVVVLLPCAAALSSAEEWSDFADNFATDLAPLITLFGEQVTKQFLSESIGILDNIIFGLAPLGILTAVVSAIRLYGRASLKSFIGRAQEAHGVAEAELCSSTSHDVCELWSNGGICRVFGRPKILEFIYTKGQNFYPSEDDGSRSNEPPHCGIYLPKDVLTGEAPDGSSRHWSEVRWSPFKVFAPFPNLSLNVGTRRTSKKVLMAAVTAGVLLEGSFFVYATWATFYNPGFYTEDDAPQIWSFVVGMAGTLSLVCGMSLCAALVERRSIERRFETRPGTTTPRILWLQCGDQRVGDQQFRSFAYSEEKKEYMTSCIYNPDLLPIFGLPPRIILWTAIVSSLLGFACQFVGFRGLHGSVALYQLACTLVMSVIRALLRSRRLGREQNRLEGFDRKSDSDELDWQALAIVGDDYPLKHEAAGSSWRQDHWTLINSHLDTGLKNSPLSKAAQAVLKASRVNVLLSEAHIGSGVLGFRFANAASRPNYVEEIVSVKSALELIGMLEGDLRHDNLTVEPLAVSDDRQVLPEFDLNPAARIVNIRARLGHLSGDQIQPPGMQWDPELQTTARRLQKALSKAVEYIFAKAPLQSGWEEAQALVWSAVSQYTVDATGEVPASLSLPIYFLAHQRGQKWTVNESQLAAVMGLCRNSLLHRPIHPKTRQDPLARYATRKIIQAVGGRDRTVALIRFWVARDCELEHRTAVLKETNTASLVPFRLSLEESIAPRNHRWYRVPGGPTRMMPYHVDPNLVRLLSLYTTGTLLDLIAQEIFTIFMFEIASIMEQLTEASVRRPVGSSPDNTILRNPNTTSSELSNTHIDSLARILCEAGLATEEAALMCIVPALFHHGKLPSLDDSVRVLLDEAKKLRADQQYEQGEDYLRSLLRICSPQHHEKLVRALGEVYRHALKSPSELHRVFGLRAMEHLKEDMVQQVDQTWSAAAMTAVSDYAGFAEFLDRGPTRTEKPWESRSRPSLGISPVLELHQGLKHPQKDRSRLKTLIVLEKYDMKGRNNPAIHELLFVAIALGHVEVLEELRALNPGLVFEAPSSGALPGNSYCATASIRSKCNANNAAQVEDQVWSGSTVGFLATVWAASQLEDGQCVPDEAEDVFKMMLDWISGAKMFTDGYSNTPLMYAVNSGNIKAVDMLLEHGADLQARNTTGETALSRAVKVGQLAIAERILKEGQERVNLPHVYVHHALIVALNDHKRDFIELLLRNGANINDRDELGDTLLSAALRPFWSNDSATGDPGLVLLLLEHGATVGQRLDDLLQLAVSNLETEWIRHLHARGHDVVGSPILRRALAAVVEADKPNERELDPDFPHASKKRHQIDTLIRFLFQLGLPVQPGDLHDAVRLRPSDDILAVILDKGTSNNAILENCGTPLQTLLDFNLCDAPAAEQERILGMMLRAGCDPNLDSPTWKATPLQIACACSEPPATEMDQGKGFPTYSGNLPSILIRAGANVNLTAADIPGEGRDLIKSTPLELACLTGKTKIVQELIEAGANVNTPGGEFGPPLQAACFQFGQRSTNDPEIVRALIKAGANIDAFSKPGGTALAVAVHSLLPELVEVLLDAGADPQLYLTTTPTRDLFPELLDKFDDMQTRSFEHETPFPDDAESFMKAVDRIIGLFARRVVVLSPEVLHPDDHYRFAHICFQPEYSALSPEEIRLSDYTVGPHHGPDAPPVMERIPRSGLRSGAFDSPDSARAPFNFGTRSGLSGGSGIDIAKLRALFGSSPAFETAGTRTLFGSNSGGEGGFGAFGSSSAKQGGLFGSDSARGGFGSNSPTQGSLLGSNAQAFGSNTSVPAQGAPFGSSSGEGGDTGLFGSNKEGNGVGATATPGDVIDDDQWETESEMSRIDGGVGEPSPQV